MSTSTSVFDSAATSNTTRFDTVMDLGSACTDAHCLLDTLRRVMLSGVLNAETNERLLTAHNAIADAMRTEVQDIVFSIANELGYHNNDSNLSDEE